MGEKSSPVCLDGLSAKVEAQGNLVRQLKGDKKPKEEIDAAVKKLLELKVNTFCFDHFGHLCLMID